jgi:polyisoprenoid-binding protein YceI
MDPGRWLIVAVAAGAVAACQPAARQEAAAPAPAQAVVTGKAWNVVPDRSRVSFVSIKGGDIAEVHHFKQVTGAVTPAGDATIRIPLDSVETAIDIRNERMRQMLFDTVRFPAAELTAKVDLAQFADLPVGERRTAPLAGELNLHGVTAPIEAQVYVTRVAPARVLVTAVDPVVVEAGVFNLGPGVEALRKVAGLDAITPAAPVTFQLMFQAAG